MRARHFPAWLRPPDTCEVSLDDVRGAHRPAGPAAGIADACAFPGEALDGEETPGRRAQPGRRRIDAPTNARSLLLDARRDDVGLEGGRYREHRNAEPRALAGAAHPAVHHEEFCAREYLELGQQPVAVDAPDDEVVRDFAEILQQSARREQHHHLKPEAGEGLQALSEELRAGIADGAESDVDDLV